jgi:2-octaprenyl-6-methoxyphenol hydroxylase
VNCDIAIVGGGMVGASLAAMLAPLRLRVVLIEAFAHDSAAQPSFDERTTALSNGSQRILETIGVWPQVAAAACPIAKIHVSDRGRFGFARIDAREQDLNAMGFVVSNRALGAALWRRLQSDEHLTPLCPAKVLEVTSGATAVSVQVMSAGETSPLSARLIVAADGTESAVRAAFGIEAVSRDYAQTALITTVLPQKNHQHVAYERFTPQGPLALLPLIDGRMTLVLTLESEAAKAALSWTDEQFIAELQQRFGFRLGRFLKVGKRIAYPLSLTRSAATSQGRCVIIGNAAQGLHPVAGMGFNLGLRDAASLAELIADGIRQPDFDPGAAALLGEYDAWRKADRGGVIAFTDGLVRAFASPLKSAAVLRNLGLLTFDLLPPAKAALSRLSTGANGRIPKLARGVALA